MPKQNYHSSSPENLDSSSLNSKQIERRFDPQESSNNLAISEKLAVLRQFRGKALWIALAVLIDGEGCINLVKDEQNRRPKYHPCITVGNTCIPWMYAWRGRVERGYVYPYLAPADNQKPHAFWKLTNRADIIHILKKVISFLAVKQEQATLLLNFYEDKVGENKTWLCEQELVRREIIYQRMRALNAKGPSESVETTRQTSQVEDDIVRAAKPFAELDANDLVN